MVNQRAKAVAEFRRMMLWVIAGGVALVIGVLAFLSSQGPLHLHMVIATVAGVFVSVVLGCGLFAAAFFSDKSGHDQDVADMSKHLD